MTDFKTDLETLNKLKEICGDDEDLLSDMIEGETDLFERLDRALYKNIETDNLIESLRLTINDLSARKKMLENRKDRIRQFIAFILEKTKKAKHESAYATASLGVIAPKPIISDESKVPSLFKKTTVEIDKAAINQAIKDGADIAGVTMDNGGQKLTIRIR